MIFEFAGITSRAAILSFFSIFLKQFNMELMTTIFWFRRDLRLLDQPLLATLEGPCFPIYILNEEKNASTAWLKKSLEALDADLEGKLTIFEEDPVEVLTKLAVQKKAKKVLFNRVYEPFQLQIEKKVVAALQKEGISVEVGPGNLLFEPWEITRKGGEPYKIFTPFWNQALQWMEEKNYPLHHLPKKIQWQAAAKKAAHFTFSGWEESMLTHWEPGEKGAKRRWEHVQKKILDDYRSLRDVPSVDGTSRLSPHIHFGEISMARLVCDNQSFMRQLGWQAFAYHLLYYFPELPTQPLKKEFLHFPWEKNIRHLHAWQKGMTGYPIIDAGMRELWQTGYMHNRVRMLAASFLVKDLLIHWTQGAEWFLETLVDADLANNSASWQWVAGCGTDAAPYFRIFNPTLQGQKFDPEGEYVRKWVPEIAHLDNNSIHTPWDVKEKLDYPAPIVIHEEAKKIALLKYKQ